MRNCEFGPILPMQLYEWLCPLWKGIHWVIWILHRPVFQYGQPAGAIQSVGWFAASCCGCWSHVVLVVCFSKSERSNARGSSGGVRWPADSQFLWTGHWGKIRVIVTGAGNFRQSYFVPRLSTGHVSYHIILGTHGGAPTFNVDLCCMLPERKRCCHAGRNCQWCGAWGLLESWSGSTSSHTAAIAETTHVTSTL